ncbi:hypothetical protein DFH29DRAFT_361255 [Suillus ampliporus]|nr:hypothetical protein DFH29DRAFT_361255 [Suillus ampliporus]
MNHIKARVWREFNGVARQRYSSACASRHQTRGCYIDFLQTTLTIYTLCDAENLQRQLCRHCVRFTRVAGVRAYRKVNPSHPGWEFVRTIVDSFEAKGPYGNHIYEPMRELTWLLQRRFVRKRYSSNLHGLTLLYLLDALDYLHSECHVIHTDTKRDNILVGMESLSVLDDVANYEAKEPSPRKVLTDRMIYLSRNRVDRSLSHTLSSLMHTVPRKSLLVRLGNTARTSGIRIWNLLEDKDLCDGFDPERQEYTEAAHLAQLIGFIGHPPKGFSTDGRIPPYSLNLTASRIGKHCTHRLLRTVRLDHLSARTSSHKVSL